MILDDFERILKRFQHPKLIQNRMRNDVNCLVDSLTGRTEEGSGDRVSDHGKNRNGMDPSVEKQICLRIGWLLAGKRLCSPHCMVTSAITGLADILHHDTLPHVDTRVQTQLQTQFSEVVESAAGAAWLRRGGSRHSV